MPGFGQRVVFEVPGPIISGNARTRSYAKPIRQPDGSVKYSARFYTTAEGRQFADKVKAIAVAAAFKARWRKPRYAEINLWGWNVYQDRENFSKILCDALQGVLIENDGRFIDGRIVKPRDKGSQRVVIEVVEVDGREYGY